MNTKPTVHADCCWSPRVAGSNTHPNTPKPLGGGRAALRLVLTWLVVLVFALAGELERARAEVGASTPTVQAAGADAAWLAYAPAPPAPGVVCMVDSGVDPNPDTTAAVVGAQALSPGTNTLDEVAALSPRVQPGDHPDGHGTLMAMTIAAPKNGWGMVGIAPTSVRVYNMKALSAGTLSFPAQEFYRAIEACQRLHEAAYPTMTVVNLSLGAQAPPEGKVLEGFERAVASARESGMSIVAAAGDTDGNVLFPASYAPVLAVGAADAGQPPGTLCSFASRGEGLDLLAPGCDTITEGLEAAFEDTGEPAYGSGASQASSEGAAVEASIDAYNPALTPQQTEACLTQTAQDGELDAAAAFRACGLAAIVQAGEQADASANTPAPPASQSPPPAKSSVANGACSSTCTASSSVTSGGVEAGCPRPVIHVSRLAAHLRVRVRPARDCALQVRAGSILRGRMHWTHTYTTTRSALTLPVHRGQALEARFLGRAAQRISSQWVPVNPGTK